MAAILGHFNFWNISSKEALENVWLRIDNIKTISATIIVPAMILSPVIVFGNLLVIISVWKDPLKKLRSSPSNFIVLSMAIADFLVGLLLCPLSVYWGFAVLYQKDVLLLPLAVSAVLTPLSIGHILLLTIDRFFALVTPLQYRVKVTRKRVCIATVTCWVYCVLCGCAFHLLGEYYIIMGTFYNGQIFFILICILVMYALVWYRFHRYSKSTELNKQSNSIRQQMLQRERIVSQAIAIVICAFLVCFLPWLIVQIVMYVCLSCYSNVSLLVLFFALSGNLVHPNSAVDPFLYAWRLQKYRDTFKHLLKKRPRCSGEQNREGADDCVYDTRL